MSLNDKQKQFLKDFLQARPTTKDPLGGRQLTKIKGEYEKFCKERQKVDELLSKLRGVPRGDVLASYHEKVLKGISDRVDVASATGDETVFKPAYKELEQTRKNLEEDIERRKKDIKATDERTEKYKKELASALKESNPNKKTEKLKSLKESIYTWLRDDHRGLDTAPVWAICEKVIAALGGPQKEDLNTVANELDSYTWNLSRDIRKADEDGIDPIVYNTAYQYDTKVHQLRADLDKYIKAAENIGDVINLKRLQRLKEDSTSLLFIVDPPPLQEDDSDEEKSEDDIVSQPQQPQKQPEKNEEEKQVTEEEFKSNILKKADSLLDRFDAAYARIKKNYQDFSGQVAGLKNKVNSSKDQLAVDLKMLDTVVADAQLKLQAGEQQLNLAKTARQLIKDGKGDWRDQFRSMGQALQVGLGEFNSGEQMIGQMEGGLLHISRSFDAVQNLTQRVRNVDEALLDTVQAKLPLLPQCSNNFTKLDPDELEMLKQLAFVSAMDNQKLTGALGTTTDRKNLDKVIKLLIEQPKHSTEALTGMMAQCQQICIDADRFFGAQRVYIGTLQQPDKDKFVKIQNLAKQDVAKYTIPVIRPRKKVPQGSKLTSVGVAVVGGGPIGLMAAVEARMSGASQVHVYEGRKDAYSRMNVLKIDKPQLQRFRSAGVYDAIFPNGIETNKEALASVKTIEIALEDRCGALGISLERGKFLKDVTRDDKGLCHLIFKGEEDKPKTCDLLIVAVGSGIAPAQKNANEIALGETLGVPFQQSEIKDYATVGLFEKTTQGRTGSAEKSDGWVYNFETDEVKYIVAQLTKEEVEAYENNPSALRERVIQEAQKVKYVDRPNGNVTPPRVSTASKDATIEDKDKNLENAITQVWPTLLQEVTGEDRFFGSQGVGTDEAFKKGKDRAIRILRKTLAEKKKKNQPQKLSDADVEAAVITCLNMEMGVSQFQMDFQQAKQFTTKNLTGVLVGDSAATPHPSTSKGLNTGVDEMGSVRDLVEDMEFGDGDEEKRQEAMRMYEWELKRRTDILVGQALEALQKGARERCNNLAYKLWQLAKPVGIPHQDFLGPIKSHNETLSVEEDSDEAKNDRDWKLREGAVKNIRDFEKQIQGAVSKIEKVLQTKPTASKEEVMAPFEEIFA